MKETLAEIRSTPVELHSEVLKKKFIDWKVNLEQIDDVLVTGIRVS